MAPMRQQPRSVERRDPPGAGRAASGTTGMQRNFITHRPSAAAHKVLSYNNLTSVLANAIETSVLPQLASAYLAPSHSAGRSLGDAIADTALRRPTLPTTDNVGTLVDLVLTMDQQVAASFVGGLHEDGNTVESLYLDLLAPAARRLGIMWQEDDCDFTDVTIGLIRLQHAMRELMPAFLGEAAKQAGHPRALLVQMPGEQHGMGLSMVIAFFRRAGWDVATQAVTSTDDLLSLVRRQSFGVVGISTSCSKHIERLASMIRGIRQASCNAAIGVMVGGPPFIEHPQLADMIGADATAIDARQAVQQAHHLIATRNVAR